MKSLVLIQRMLKATQDYLDTTELPSQDLFLFAIVAERGEVPQSELGDLIGLSQPSISRICSRLGRGVPGLGKRAEVRGMNLVETHEDPFFRKRKIVKLTARGAEFAHLLEKSIAHILRK